jgi:hypothetical protein
MPTGGAAAVLVTSTERAATITVLLALEDTGDVTLVQFRPA